VNDGTPLITARRACGYDVSVNQSFLEWKREAARDRRKGARLPRLLPVVYCVTLALVVLSCGALAMLGSAHVLSATINATVAGDQAVVRAFLLENLSPQELNAQTIAPARQRVIADALEQLVADHGLAAITLVSNTGAVLAQTGQAPAALPATGLESSTTVERRTSDESIPSGSALVETLPTVTDGRPGVTAIVERDAGGILAAANGAWSDVIVVMFAAAVVLFVVLYLIFRAAHLRLMNQAAQLHESERRDPLTGLLNHGAVVRALGEAMESASKSGNSLGVMLLDIDNFGLLNAVHGDLAGDFVLREVAAAVTAESQRLVTFGRYGPDEFLVVAANGGRELEMRAKAIQAGLGRREMQFGDSERLVITVSAGISYFPFHATSITDLLSAATISLASARASGGNEVRIADASSPATIQVRQTFDVFQGLVTAVDAKDRYTKKHSDEVASYSLFLANWLGLSLELRHALEMSALLHDVGKIGVPEEILRKPGRLTAAEYDILKQHVLLGDLIVRELPDIELIRLGILHHHERYDGSGYLAGLSGDEIPLIARLIAVGDAFSAMTTNRPYRSALSTEEAMKRLRDAAGTQLDPDLVEPFLEGLRTAPDAPLPGTDRVKPALWSRGIAAA
jgi:diguanylate cyclase (GGDEF)-like protein